MKKEQFTLQEFIRNHYLKGRPLSALTEKEKNLMDYFILAANVSERLASEKKMEKLSKG